MVFGSYEWILFHKSFSEPILSGCFSGVLLPELSCQATRVNLCDSADIAAKDLSQQNPTVFTDRQRSHPANSLSGFFGWIPRKEMSTQEKSLWTRHPRFVRTFHLSWTSPCQLKTVLPCKMLSVRFFPPESCWVRPLGRRHKVPRAEYPIQVLCWKPTCDTKARPHLVNTAQWRHAALGASSLRRRLVVVSRMFLWSNPHNVPRFWQSSPHHYKRVLVPRNAISVNEFSRRNNPRILCAGEGRAKLILRW